MQNLEKVIIQVVRSDGLIVDLRVNANGSILSSGLVSPNTYNEPTITYGDPVTAYVS